MSQPSLILKLEKTFAEKLYPEVLRLKKELGMNFFYFTESLYIDKKNAFKRLISNPKFQKWLKIRSSSEYLTQIDIETKVNELMQEENLKIEYL